jgi:NAD(P)-dependent dehydrogenase (short-subunit alcohol dehydrogenase family)
MSKVWFITGASRGIGAEIAKAALASGDRVVATGRNRAQVEKAFAGSERLLAVELDVTDAAQAHRAVDAALAKFGRIDVLVNNAGYGQLGAFEENETGDIEQQYATNVFGLFHVTRAVLPVLRRQRGGHIFNLSSMAGVLGFASASIYCSTKFAIEGFSESLALEVAQFGIKITIVEPGFFRTDFLDTSSIRYGGKVVDDYVPSSTELKATFDSYSHKQAGDPVKLGLALVQLANVANPPLRYAAGSDSAGGISKKLTAMQSEIDQWRALSVSTDHAQ